MLPYIFYRMGASAQDRVFLKPLQKHALNYIPQHLTQATTTLIVKVEKIRFFEWQSRFQTEQGCLIYLQKLKWPNGFICPQCGHDHAYSSRYASFTSAVLVSIKQHSKPVPFFIVAISRCANGFREFISLAQANEGVER